jgi:hypothetical protein
LYVLALIKDMYSSKVGSANCLQIDLEVTSGTFGPEAQLRDARKIFGRWAVFEVLGTGVDWLSLWQ